MGGCLLVAAVEGFCECRCVVDASCSLVAACLGGSGSAVAVVAGVGESAGSGACGGDGHGWAVRADGWIERDTLNAPLSPTNANRYAYAGDDPINKSDSTGRYSYSTLEFCLVICSNGGSVLGDGRQGYTYGTGVETGTGISANGMWQSGSGYGGSKTYGFGCSVGAFNFGKEWPADGASSGGWSYGINESIPPNPVALDCSFGIQYSYVG